MTGGDENNPIISSFYTHWNLFIPCHAISVEFFRLWTKSHNYFPKKSLFEQKVFRFLGQKGDQFEAPKMSQNGTYFSSDLHLYSTKNSSSITTSCNTQTLSPRNG